MQYYEQDHAPKWGIYQVTAAGPEVADPFTEGAFGATFTNGAESRYIPGFYDGDGLYRVRFMPESEGLWRYETTGAAPALCNVKGEFLCTKPEPHVHGPVRVADQYHFAFADGTPFFPYGTTCYVWVYQDEKLRRQTLETLKRAPFNKMRMCVFPKHFVYNLREPEDIPCLRRADGSIDFDRYNPAFFRAFEARVAELMDLGIEADIILLHPYDKWGFATMTAEQDDKYLRYIVARLASFRNVWWAMANEYDVMRAKTDADWTRMGELVKAIDPYDHLRSIHNCMRHFDQTEKWITHASAQRIDLYRTTEDTDVLLKKWQKPILWDEIAYEGNIPDGWGNITGQELMRRYWEAAIRGSYPGHGETLLEGENDENAILWWSHGGELRGESPDRIAFLREIFESAPARYESRQVAWDLHWAHIGDQQMLAYHGFMQPIERKYPVPMGSRYRAEVIDTWAMRITDAGIIDAEEADPWMPEAHRPRDEQGNPLGFIKVKLPQRQYMAVRLTKA